MPKIHLLIIEKDSWVRFAISPLARPEAVALPSPFFAFFEE
jgi:hypothetical protein